MRQFNGSAWSRAFALISAGVILTVTLTPVAGNGPAPGPDACTACGVPVIADMILNTLLFVPLGVFLCGAGVGGWAATAIGLTLSVAVEGIQVWLPGRFPTVADLVFNTAGTVLGVAVFRYGIPSLLSGAARSRALPWAAVLAGAIAATAWLVVPAPPDTVYYGQWTADLGHLEHYRGRVVRARLGALAVPDGRLQQVSADLRRLIEAGAPLEVVLEAGPPVEDLAPIFSIFDENQREVLLLGVDREDLVFRLASRAGGLGLRDPEHRLEGGARLLAPGAPARVAVVPSRAGVCIAVNDRRRCGIGDEAWSGWALLLPRHWFRGSAADLIGALWLGLLALPVGLWGGTSFYAVAGWLVGMLALTAAPAAGLVVPAAAPAILTVTVMAGAWAGDRLRAFSPPGSPAHDRILARDTGVN